VKGVTYRTVEIAWSPRSSVSWETFTLARSAAAKFWDTMASIHARIRRLGWKWPTRAQWSSWATMAGRRFRGIGAQTIQRIANDFHDAILSTSAARRSQRRSGVEITKQYPWKTQKYRDVPYSNQQAKFRGGWLILPHGRGDGRLRVKIPHGVALPGRVMAVTLSFGTVSIVCATGATEPVPTAAPVIGVDLGVNTIACASDGHTAVVISGRGMKAIQQYRNKMLGQIKSRISKTKSGSRLNKKLQRRKRKHLAKSARKQRDFCHKTTSAIAASFPGVSVVVGRAFHESASKMSRRNAQQVSQACTGKITKQLNYKLSGANVVPESYSSQTCPVCGCLQKCKRVYRCKACSLTAPRDVVGAVNIRAIGLYGKLMPEQPMPTVVRFVRPLRKYPRPSQDALGSSGGTPASSSEAA